MALNPLVWLPQPCSPGCAGTKQCNKKTGKCVAIADVANALSYLPKSCVKLDDADSKIVRLSDTSGPNVLNWKITNFMHTPDNTYVLRSTEVSWPEPANMKGWQQLLAVNPVHDDERRLPRVQLTSCSDDISREENKIAFVNWVEPHECFTLTIDDASALADLHPVGPSPRLSNIVNIRAQKSSDCSHNEPDVLKDAIYAFLGALEDVILHNRSSKDAIVAGICTTLSVGTPQFRSRSRPLFLPSCAHGGPEHRMLRLAMLVRRGMRTTGGGEARAVMRGMIRAPTAALPAPTVMHWAQSTAMAAHLRKYLREQLTNNPDAIIEVSNQQLLLKYFDVMTAQAPERTREAFENALKVAQKCTNEDDAAHQRECLNKQINPKINPKINPTGTHDLLPRPHKDVDYKYGTSAIQHMAEFRARRLATTSP